MEKLGSYFTSNLDMHLSVDEFGRFFNIELNYLEWIVNNPLPNNTIFPFVASVCKASILVRKFPVP